MDIKPNNYLDAEIANEIMGWPTVQAGGEEWVEKAVLAGVRFPIFAVWPEGGTEVLLDAGFLGKNRLFHPSSDVAHAFEAADKLRERGYSFAFHGDREGWDVEVFLPDGKDLVVDQDLNLAPALSKAMLAAVRKEGSSSSSPKGSGR